MTTEDADSVLAEIVANGWRLSKEEKPAWHVMLDRYEFQAAMDAIDRLVRDEPTRQKERLPKWQLERELRPETCRRVSNEPVEACAHCNSLGIVLVPAYKDDNDWLCVTDFCPEDRRLFVLSVPCACTTGRYYGDYDDMCKQACDWLTDLDVKQRVTDHMLEWVGHMTEQFTGRMKETWIRQVSDNAPSEAARTGKYVRYVVSRSVQLLAEKRSSEAAQAGGGIPRDSKDAKTLAGAIEGIYDTAVR